MEQEIMKIFHNKLYVFLGFIITAIILYYRFVHVRLPRDLLTHLTYDLICLYLCIILGFFMTLVYSLYNILCFYNILKPKDTKIFVDMKPILYIRKLQNFYYNCLRSFDIYIRVNFTDIVIKFSFELLDVMTKQLSYKKIYYLNWIFDYCVRILISMAFVFDVFWLHSFYFFFKALILLLIPLIYNYICYTMKDICIINIDDCSNYFNIYDLKENHKIFHWDYVKHKLYLVFKNVADINYVFDDDYLLNNNLEQFRFEFSQSYLEKYKDHLKSISDTEVTELFFEHYLGFHKTFILPFIYLTRLEILKETQGQFIRFITSLIFFIGWIYILFYGLNIY